jgi:ABC-type multidrug transport system ATPase subunit
LKGQITAPQNSEFKIQNSKFEIEAAGLSKRFNREWVFKNLDYTFQSGKTYAITGPNGSGKSTLLQILWGQLPPTSGTVTYDKASQIQIPAEEIFKHLSIATPYMDLIEELTLDEHIRFHFRMRQIRNGLTHEDILEKLYLKEARDKNIANFSSGMKQRLKLGLAFYTEAKALFLDEPGTNLDERGLTWYTENLKELSKDLLVFIASNQRSEYPETAEILNLLKFNSRAENR